MTIKAVIVKSSDEMCPGPELVLTPRGRERTKAEFVRLLRGAGFRLSRVIATESPLSIVEAVKA